MSKRSTPTTSEWPNSVARAKQLIADYKARGYTNRQLINLLYNCCQNVPLKYVPQLFDEASDC